MQECHTPYRVSDLTIPPHSSRKKSKKNKEKEQRESEGEDDFNPKLRMPRRFSYEELRVATEDFKDRLGGGGFGTVFRGELEDNTRITVKRLESRGQGMKEFLAEVETVGNIHHVNLVRLIGFCTERSCKLLVYEYMNNGSLDAWIFNSQRNQDIDWQTRKKIILGIAKGLANLHEECFQRIMDRDQSQVQTTIRGTPGYLVPEWRQLRITLKIDEELDSSRSESSEHLLRLLQEKAEAGRLMDIAEGSRTDTQLHGDEVLRTIVLAIWCLQDDHARRPQMSVVVKVLEGAMEVDPNISYRFSNAMAQAPAIPSHSDPPPASVLSAPR
ncbi:hypothetical protein ACLOJK_038267 [Asimina triloba]